MASHVSSTHPVDSAPLGETNGARSSHAPPRVVLVDRDPLARRTMRDELTASGEFVIAAESGEEDEAVTIADREQPDLVLVDIGYPRMSGIGVAKALRRRLPETPIVFCSITDDDDTAFRALAVGAVGFIRKDLASRPLARALHGALNGEAAISRQLARRLIEEFSRQAEPRTRPRPAGGELTTREWEVLDLLIAGASTATIAETLGLALETVRSHVKHVLRKIGVGTRSEAIDIARRLRARQS